MTYKILKGEELGFNYLQKIIDIDEEVYSDLGMEGARIFKSFHNANFILAQTRVL